MPVGAVPFPFGVCRICKDKATGLHYGVATCEGCKGFFKRSITKGEPFKCMYSDNCDITPLTRSRCKACRFKRCMETGMSVDAVRMGRIPKTEKNKVLDRFRRGGSDFNKHELIVNATGSGNFDFELKTTSVTTNTHIPKPITFNSKFVSAVSTSMSNVESDTSITQLGSSNVDINNACSFENSTSTSLVVQEYNSTSDDQFSSFLSRVGLSLQQNLCIPNTDSGVTYDDNSSVDKVNVPNDCSTSPVNVTGCKQHLPSCSRIRDLFSISANAEEVNCDNPFSDAYCSNNSLLCQQPGDECSFAKTVQGTMDQKQGFVSRESHGWSSTRPPCDRIPSTCTDVDMSPTDNLSDTSCISLQSNIPGLDSKCTGPDHDCVIHSTTQHGNVQHRLCGGNDTSLGNFKRTHSFSRGLVNVLIEQILKSKGGAQVVCDKIEQTIQRGRMDDGQTSKRMKFECGHNIGCSLNNTNEPVLNSKNVVAMIDSGTTNRTLETDVTSLHKQASLDAPCASRCGCQLAKTRGTNEKESNSSANDDSQQKIYLNIQGITLGMTILFRLLPEHREKIRQYRLGLIDLHIMREDEVEETYKKVIECIPDINERIIGFCNCVPGIDDISVNDKAALLKRAYYDIWMLSSAEYFNNQESMMFLKSGEIYSTPVMRKILNDEMVDTILKFANQFNALGLTDLEKAILCAVRLSAPESLELEDRASVDQFHSHMLDTFAYEIKKNHEQHHARLLIDTFCTMPLLETVNKIQSNIIAKFSIEPPSNSS